MKKVLTVEGMTCSHCERAVIEALEELDQVLDVKVDLVTGQVEVQGNNLNDGSLKEKVDEAGYKVTKID